MRHRHLLFGDAQGGFAANPTLRSKFSFYADLTDGSTTTEAVAANDLTNNAVVTFVAGGTPAGYSKYVVASSQYLSRASFGAVEVVAGQSFCISAWVNLDDLLTANKAIVGKDVSGGREYYLSHVVGTNRFTLDLNVGGTMRTVTNATVPLKETWYHVVAWFDAGTGRMSITVDNGTPVVSLVLSGNLVPSSTEFNIGSRRFVGNINFMGGRITRVGIGRFVPTAAEITHLFNAGAGRLYSEITI